jgi:hypothetical protein
MSRPGQRNGTGDGDGDGGGDGIFLHYGIPAVEFPDGTRIAIVPLEEVLFAVTDVAVRAHRVIGSRLNNLPLARGTYLATRSAIYRVHGMSFAELQRRLPNSPFLQAHHGTIINLSKVRGIDVRGRKKLLGVDIGHRMEWVELSRRRFRECRHQLGV